MTDMIAHFRERTNEIIGLLRQLVEIESPSTDKAATERIGQYVAELARSLGGSVASVSGGRWGDHTVARFGGAGVGFLILSHLDTVWPAGTLRQRPWMVEQDRAYGPGVLDAKSGTAVALSALAELRRLGIPLSMPVTAVFNTDEEVGSRSSRPLIEELAADAMVVLCMEPAMPNGALKVWRKGTGRYVIKAFGRAVHAGSDHEKGVNAIEELAHQIIRLQEMTDYQAGTTVNVGWIQGGTRTNIVPDTAEARVDVRIARAEEGNRMDAVIKSLRPVLPASRLIVEGCLSRPPMEASDVTMEPFRRARAAAVQIGIDVSAGGSGGASDANFTAALGVPTLDGLGGVGDGAHSVGEFVSIASLPERAALFAALLSRWDGY